MAQTDYDVLIIGSGAGGGAALWRLCEQWGDNGKKIGMVEAGDLLLPTHGRNLPTFDEERLNQFINNPKFSDARACSILPHRRAGYEGQSKLRRRIRSAK
ncbi:MAG TPA: hypothetical protein VL921_19435 [Candidatus Udaeobacter sp.]|jgi:choline dehydrogenase-like flavoprotein|nr:hypothetical protein [Candidatus Udaeobacter sp.]